MKNARPVSIAEAERPLYVGVDVGGTGIKIGLVDSSGRTVIRDKIPTKQERGPQDAMQRVASVISKMLDRSEIDAAEIKAVGLATPGTMDIRRGLLISPHNLRAWWNFPIRDCLKEACGKPVAFANDANAAAYGEFWVGSGSAFHSMAFFTLGTGVGGGIIIGDLTIEGENSAGSELGHTIIDFTNSARRCGCGQLGHLEAYASARAVVKRTEEMLAEGQKTSIRERVEAGDELTPLLIANEAESGDDAAYEIVMDTAKYLGIGAVNAMHTVDPGAVIFGGAMTFGGHDSKLGQAFLNRIRQEVFARAFPFLEGRTVIDFARLGGDAGYIGAAGVSKNVFRDL